MLYLEMSVMVSYLNEEGDKKMTEAPGIYLGMDEADDKHCVYIGSDPDADRVYAENTDNIRYISGEKKSPGSVYWGTLRKTVVGPEVTEDQIATRFKQYNTEINKIKNFIKSRK